MKILLSTICIALLALFAYQVMSYPLDMKDSRSLSLDKELAKSIDYDLPQLAVLNDIDEYSEIVQRPLFVKDRAAAISSRTVNKVTTVDELAHLILVGTASSSDVQIAIVADTKAKQMERLKAGESYKEWDIAEVSSDHVVFQNVELEYKLFITPIKGSQKDKQAKLVSQLNKLKKDKATTAKKSFKSWGRSNKINTNSSNIASTKQKAGGTGNLWSYRNKSQKKDSSNSGDLSGAKDNNKPVRRSPIKIPGEEEKDAAYYEAEYGDDENSSTASNSENAKKEISVEDYYDDEEITEDELKALEVLGAKIFDD